jgi:hypothetical protein
MSFLALTRGGVASVVQDNPKSACLWVGSDVLSEVEVQKLRAAGLEISIFIYPIRTENEIQDAVPTLREHHPTQTVWIEEVPESYNPKSADIGQAFLWREYIVGVKYTHNEPVAVVAGPHAGEQGILVSLISLEPEPEFILEAESGQDIKIRQSSLARTDA